MTSSQIQILSTKKITDNQRSILKNILIDNVPFIKTTKKEDISIDFPIKNAIFTSKNAVRALLTTYKKEDIQIENSYCVGEKTANLLKKEEFNVVDYHDTAKQLGNAICQDKKFKNIHFFCGNLRGEDLFTILGENNIKIIEKIVYQTELTPVKISKNYDGILFYSPSAIKSFLLENEVQQCPVFCIGTTTAATAKKYFKTVVVAKKPSVENVLNLVNQYYE